MTKIAFYISSHGYGHAVRSIEIINSVPQEIDIIICSGIEKIFFEFEVKRNFSYRNISTDVGCIQKNVLHVDIEKTLKTYVLQINNNKKLLESEISFLKENGVSLVISDIASFPLYVAKKAGIKSVGISNFTWLDIYAPYIKQYPEYSFIIDTLRIEYEAAFEYYPLLPAMDNFFFDKKYQIPYITAYGTSKRDVLKKKYNIDYNKKICLVYLGKYGLENVKWEKIDNFDDWVFIGLYPLENAGKNYRLIDKKDISYLDLVASSDLIIGKIGYGLMTQCMTNGIPLIYVPRYDFAEHDVLKKHMAERGNIYEVDVERFKNMNIDIELSEAKKFSPHRTLGVKYLKEKILDLL